MSVKVTLMYFVTRAKESSRTENKWPITFKSLMFATFLGVLVPQVSNAKASTFQWEGKWAQINKAQCLCAPGSVDVCAEGKGLPPLLINRKEVIAPDLFCTVKRIDKATDAAFSLSAICSIEGEEVAARITGILKSRNLQIQFNGPNIDNFWAQGDWNTFKKKC